MKNFEEVGTCNSEKGRIVFAGQIDHGKSSVIGRLLVDSGTVSKETYNYITELCKKNNQEFKYEYLVDALAVEKRAHITVNCARIFLLYNNCIYTLIDTPGHVEYINSMVSGAAQAEVSVFIVDIKEGLTENAKIHLEILKLFGVKKIIIAINKLDTVGYNQLVYEKMIKDLQKYTSEKGVNIVAYIPISARKGDNIIQNSVNMPWYFGKTLIQLLEFYCEIITKKENLPFCMMIQDSYKWEPNKRGYVGKVISGRIKTGDNIVCVPSGLHSKIERMCNCNGDINEITKEMSVALYLEQELEIKRGELICDATKESPSIKSRIKATVFWSKPLNEKTDVHLDLRRGTSSVGARLLKIQSFPNNSTITECYFELDTPLAIDYGVDECIRFVLVKDGEAYGGGIINEKPSTSKG